MDTKSIIHVERRLSRQTLRHTASSKPFRKRARESLKSPASLTHKITAAV